MSIITEYPYIDINGYKREDLVRNYSNQKFRIIQSGTGNIYDEAIDTYPSKYFYTETDEKIEEDVEEEIDYETAYNNLAAEVMSNE